MTVPMLDNEKRALHLYRYRQWAGSHAAARARVEELQREIMHQANMANMAWLECREERDTLISLGLSEEEIDRVSPMPQDNFTPMAIVATAMGESSS
jgi:hypothetical protein